MSPESRGGELEGTQTRTLKRAAAETRSALALLVSTESGSRVVLLGKRFNQA